jgi:hypothetical protein
MTRTRPLQHFQQSKPYAVLAFNGMWISAYKNVLYGMPIFATMLTNVLAFALHHTVILHHGFSDCMQAVSVTNILIVKSDIDLERQRCMSAILLKIKNFLFPGRSFHTHTTGD